MTLAAWAWVAGALLWAASLHVAEVRAFRKGYLIALAHMLAEMRFGRGGPPATRDEVTRVNAAEKKLREEVDKDWRYL